MRGISRRQFVAAVVGLTATALSGCGSGSADPLSAMPGAVGTPAGAATATPQMETLTQGQIDAAEAILKRLVTTGNVPGVSYSIGNANGVLAANAFGQRVLSPPAPMTVETRSALASMSKQFVSGAAWLLVQQGALSMTAPLSDYLPDYVHAREITMLQILTMRSGVPAADDRGEPPIDGVTNDSTLIENLNKYPLDFSPGQYFAYSNNAYNLAGVVIGRIAGMSYGAFVEKYLFTPLGMSSTSLLGMRNDSNFALGYAAEGSGFIPSPYTVADAAFGSGNLASTPLDLQAWNRSLVNATLLTRATQQQMFALPDTPDTVISHYACGWFIDPNGVIWHPGGLSGYQTSNVLFPMTGHSIALLSNTSKPWERGPTALAMYRAANLGPALAPLQPLVRSTVPDVPGTGDV